MKRFQYLLIFQFSLLLLLNLSLCASGAIDFPQESVKLTGKYYSFPIGLDGSPYLIEDWKEGNINLENGKTASTIKIRFNILTNDLVFYNETLKRVFISDKETVKTFLINPGRNDSLFFIKYTGTDIGFKLKTNDFVHVLSQGKINFFVKHTANVIDATETNSRDKVFPKDYYFLNINSNTTEIKLTYRTIFKLFPSMKKEIKRMISENKLNKANESNFVRLLNLLQNDSRF